MDNITEAINKYLGSDELPTKCIDNFNCDKTEKYKRKLNNILKKQYGHSIQTDEDITDPLEPTEDELVEKLNDIFHETKIFASNRIDALAKELGKDQFEKQFNDSKLLNKLDSNGQLINSAHIVFMRSIHCAFIKNNLVWPPDSAHRFDKNIRFEKLKCLEDYFNKNLDNPPLYDEVINFLNIINVMKNHDDNIMDIPMNRKFNNLIKNRNEQDKIFGCVQFERELNNIEKQQILYYYRQAIDTNVETNYISRFFNVYMNNFIPLYFNLLKQWNAPKNITYLQNYLCLFKEQIIALNDISLHGKIENSINLLEKGIIKDDRLIPKLAACLKIIDTYSLIIKHAQKIFNVSSESFDKSCDILIDNTELRFYQNLNLTVVNKSQIQTIIHTLTLLNSETVELNDFIQTECQINRFREDCSIGTDKFCTMLYDIQRYIYSNERNNFCSNTTTIDHSYKFFMNNTHINTRDDNFIINKKEFLRILENILCMYDIYDLFNEFTFEDLLLIVIIIETNLLEIGKKVFDNNCTSDFNEFLKEFEKVSGKNLYELMFGDKRSLNDMIHNNVNSYREYLCTQVQYLLLGLSNIKNIGKCQLCLVTNKITDICNACGGHYCYNCCDLVLRSKCCPICLYSNNISTRFPIQGYESVSHESAIPSYKN
jgi:hypothetical protein